MSGAGGLSRLSAVRELPPVLKELMVMSLICTNHAREISSRLDADRKRRTCAACSVTSAVLIAITFPTTTHAFRSVRTRAGVSGAANNVLGFR
jgi:hypothetical protein